MNANNKKFVKRIIYISIGIIAISLVSVNVFCNDSNPSGLCTAPGFEIVIGAILGIATTACFFLFIDQGQRKIEDELKESNRKLEEIFKSYSARTALFNLKGIFTGGDDRVEANDYQRGRFLSLLKEKYLDKYPDPNQIAIEVYRLAENHEIKTEHGHKECEKCKEITNKIIAALREIPQPLL